MGGKFFLCDKGLALVFRAISPRLNSFKINELGIVLKVMSEDCGGDEEKKKARRSGPSLGDRGPIQPPPLPLPIPLTGRFAPDVMNAIRPHPMPPARISSTCMRAV